MNICIFYYDDFADFAIELGRIFGLYSNDEEYKTDIKWVKNLK